MDDGLLRYKVIGQYELLYLHAQEYPISPTTDVVP